MKIELDIPDRARGRYITIFAGSEMIAFKHPSKDVWEIIEEGCIRCGMCCRDQDETWVFYDEKKGCKYLESAGGNDFKCGLGAYRPFGCSCSTSEVEDYCAIKKRKVIKAQG